MDLHVQDLAEALSDTKAWNTPCKVCHSTFERKPYGKFGSVAPWQQPSIAVITAGPT